MNDRQVNKIVETSYQRDLASQGINTATVMSE